MACFPKAFSSFSTTRGITVERSGFGVLHKVGLIGVICYIIAMIYFYTLYNEVEQGRSGMVVKVKGVNLVKQVWDSADYVFPPQETHAFFISTNVWTTRQKQGKCPDVNKKNEFSVNCTHDSQCTKGRKTRNGFQTGRCSKTADTCEINSWCPVEGASNTTTEKRLFTSIGHYTVLLKNIVKFEKFKETLSNIPENFDTTCLYHPKKMPLCPIFNISTILELADVNYNDAMHEGAIIIVTVKWKCFFNWPKRDCTPEFHFVSLEDSTIMRIKGYNYRYSIYDYENKTRWRDLYKLYGIRFYIYVFAEGQRFSFATFVGNLGALLVYLANVSVIIAILIWLLSTCACCDPNSQNCCARFFHYTLKVENKIESTTTVPSPCCFKASQSSLTSTDGKSGDSRPTKGKTTDYIELEDLKKSKEMMT